jgi:hypothetical protein
LFITLEMVRVDMPASSARVAKEAQHWPDVALAWLAIRIKTNFSEPFAGDSRARLTSAHVIDCVRRFVVWYYSSVLFLRK